MIKTDFGPRQQEIIQLLLSKPYIQKDLQHVLGISSPGLLYHLNKLEVLKFIRKKTIRKVGNAKINEISLEPLQLQNIRTIFNIETPSCTLLTGFGELATGYRIPDEAYALLQNKHYKIDHVVCITTKKGKKIRKSKQAAENLIEITRYYADYEYNDFRNLKSRLFSELDEILRKELVKSNLVIDITPLSKLFSFELLKRANEYQLACYYLGKDEDGEDSLIWMTDVQLTGAYK
jgi:DNA-binding MarR family transcriptional regulator